MKIDGALHVNRARNRGCKVIALSVLCDCYNFSATIFIYSQRIPSSARFLFRICQIEKKDFYYFFPIFPKMFGSERKKNGTEMFESLWNMHVCTIFVYSIPRMFQKCWKLPFLAIVSAQSKKMSFSTLHFWLRCSLLARNIKNTLKIEMNTIKCDKKKILHIDTLRRNNNKQLIFCVSKYIYCQL